MAEKEEQNEQTSNNLDLKQLNKVVKAYVVNIIRKIQAGDVGLSREIEFLQSLLEKKDRNDVLTKDDEEVGIPERLKIRRPYCISDKAIEQRKRAGEKKKRSDKYKGNKNAWKHGKYVKNVFDKLKPCKSTCEFYPCSLVNEGKTSPGGLCLDKVDILYLKQTLEQAVKNKNYDAMNEMASLVMAQNLHILHLMQADVIRDGPTIKREKLDKDGKVIGVEFVPHPSLAALPKIAADLGLTLNDFMVTPSALSKTKEQEKDRETLADFTSRLLKSLDHKKEDGSTR